MRALPSTVILASAGSGKTHSLTTRYLRLLLAGVAPERILATTFTRKAAGEIFERLIGRLVGACRDRQACADLGGAVADPSLSQERCRGVLRTLVDSLDRVAVCTIDSFFLRMAGSFTLDLALPPGWSIADDEADRALHDAAIGRIFEAADDRELLARVRLLNRGRYSARIVSAVRRGVDEMYQASRDAPPGAWDVVGPLTHMITGAQIAAAVQALRDLPAPLTGGRSPRPHRQWENARDSLLKILERAGWADDFLDCTIVKAALGGGDFAGVPVPAEWRAVLGTLGDHARALVLEILAGQNRAAREVLARFEHEYRAVRAEAGLYGFDDVPRALREAGACGDLQHLYYRLDGRIDHLLLDEFQDTSLTQFGLLEPIIDELVTRAEEGRSFFCVGDVKQSLYQWRNAEPALLPAVPKRWTVLRQEHLDASRRSSPVIVEAVNRVFAGLNGNPCFLCQDKGRDDRASAALWQQGFRRHQTARREDGYACLLTAPAPRDDGTLTPSAMRVRAALELAADRVRALVDRVPGASVGVLVPLRRNIARLIHLLRQRGVEASEESGNSVADSAAVAAALSLLHLADHPGDTAAGFHAATSPLGGAVGLAWPPGEPEVRRVASAIRRALVEEGYGDTLASWLRRIAASCAPRDHARFEQLVALGREFDRRAGLRPDEFVELVRRRRVEAPIRAQVRVMTVHASKGLEFDAVVLPELEGRLTGPRFPALLIEREHPLGPVVGISRYVRAAVRAAHPLLERMHQRWRQREIGEQLCLLYVAMTRARRHLEMIVQSTAKSDIPLTYAGLLRGALAPRGPVAPAAVLWASGNPGWTLDADRQAAAVPAAEAEPLTISLRRADHKTLRHLPRRSPSAHADNLRVDLARVLVPEAGAAAERGRLFHAWFELVEWLDDGAPEDSALAMAARRLGLEGRDVALARQIAEFRSMLAVDAVRAILGRARYRERWGAEADLLVHRERPFAMRDADPGSGVVSLLTGRIDRVVVGVRAGAPIGAEIIDFKTDAIDGKAQAAKAAEFYAPQMQAYRRAAARMLGLPAAGVDVTLALVGAGLVLDVPQI